MPTICAPSPPGVRIANLVLSVCVRIKWMENRRVLSSFEFVVKDCKQGQEKMKYEGNGLSIWKVKKSATKHYQRKLNIKEHQVCLHIKMLVMCLMRCAIGLLHYLLASSISCTEAVFVASEIADSAQTEDCPSFNWTNCIFPRRISISMFGTWGDV